MIQMNLMIDFKRPGLSSHYVGMSNLFIDVSNTNEILTVIDVSQCDDDDVYSFCQRS